MNQVGAIAQSNIQLYGQLQSCGYGAADISAVARAYRLAQRLFAASFRGSGRPFLCHLVGTASILVRDAAPAHEITAGLLHAAYSAGLFPFDMHRKMSPRKRAMVREAVGAEAEELIADELDDLADNGLYYSGAAKRALVADPENRRLLVLLASRAGMPILETCLKTALAGFAETDHSLEAASGAVCRDYSYTLLPPSARERLSHRAAILRRKIQRRLGRQ
jgi:hypothetical protein